MDYSINETDLHNHKTGFNGDGYQSYYESLDDIEKSVATNIFYNKYFIMFVMCFGVTLLMISEHRFDFIWFIGSVICVFGIGLYSYRDAKLTEMLLGR